MNGPEQTQHIKVITVYTLPLHPYDALQTSSKNTRNKRTSIQLEAPRNSDKKHAAQDKHVLQSILTIAHTTRNRDIDRRCTNKRAKKLGYTRSIRRGHFNDNSNTWNTGSQNPFTQSSKSLNIPDYTSNLTQRIQNRFYYLTAAITLALPMIHQPKGREPPHQASISRSSHRSCPLRFYSPIKTNTRTIPA